MYSLTISGLEPFQVVALLEANVAGLTEAQLTGSVLTQTASAKEGIFEMITPEERDSANIDNRIKDGCEAILNLQRGALGLNVDDVSHMDRQAAITYLIAVTERYIDGIKDADLRGSPDVRRYVLSRVVGLLDADEYEEAVLERFEQDYDMGATVFDPRDEHL